MDDVKTRTFKQDKALIEGRVTEIFGDGNPNVFFGETLGTLREGWHYQPFNANAIYLGEKITDAMRALDQHADFLEQAPADAIAARVAEVYGDTSPNVFFGEVPDVQLGWVRGWYYKAKFGRPILLGADAAEAFDALDEQAEFRQEMRERKAASNE